MNKMSKKQVAAMGGIAVGKIRRERALKQYLENPNLCQNCHLAILPQTDQKLGEVRIKKFCNKKCAAVFNNRLRWGDDYKPPQKIKKDKIITDGSGMTETRFKKISKLTKAEIFKESKSWQSARGAIRRHAQKTILISGRKKECAVCHYSIFVELCHIIAVKTFSPETLIEVINDEKNLIFLCPNHHKEQENNIIDISKYQ